MPKPQAPAIEGWFVANDGPPALLGGKCPECGTYAFPKRVARCPNPDCTSETLEDVRIGSRGKLWSYTTNHYEPPEPYVAPKPFQPYTVAAVELDDAKIIVLGQLAEGASPASLSIGMPMELVVETLFEDPEREHTMWKWKPAQGEAGR
jgi:uncharacterized OB-fold protein